MSGLPDEKVDAYTELDLRLGWELRPQLEFAIVGRNLLNGSHSEFGSNNTLGVLDPVEIERSLMGTVTWRFD